jgi:hypothetical protein
MRLRLILWFHILLVIGLAPAWAQSAAGTGTKTLLITGLLRASDPVRIKVMNGATELKSDGRRFPNNHAWETTFNAGDDWITDLSFWIKNVSAKKITCVIIFSGLFDTPFWQDETQSKHPGLGIVQNRIGQRPEHALHTDGRSFPPDADPPFELSPWQEFTMVFENPQDYPTLKAHIETWGPISNVTAVDGGIVTVFFEDGTKWVSVSHSYSRPAEQPGKWTKISYEEWAGQPKSAEP